MKQMQPMLSKDISGKSNHKNSHSAPTATSQTDDILNLQRTFGNRATIQMMKDNQVKDTPSGKVSPPDFFSGLQMVNRKQTVEATQSQPTDTIQRVALTQTQFGGSLSDLLFGDSYETAKQALGRKFTTDLAKEAKGNYDSSQVMQIGNPVTKFVSVLDAALKYRASKASVVKKMQQTKPYANFGDTTSDGEKLKGGTSNAWESLNVNSLPTSMQAKMPGYVKGLHNSVSMGGNGYDYRPSKGVLFHIKK